MNLLVEGMAMMAVAQQDAVGQARQHQRVDINLLGRFMLANKHEYPCQVMNISPGGAQFKSPVSGQLGERVVAYLDHVGRIEGTLVRVFDGGFSLEIKASPRKREKLANQLTWLFNREKLDLPEDRRFERMFPKYPVSQLALSDGSLHECHVIDISLSGAAISVGTRPPIGSLVHLAKMRGRVVRIFDDGIAIEFSEIQDPKALAYHFGAGQNG